MVNYPAGWVASFALEHMKITQLVRDVKGKNLSPEEGSDLDLLVGGL
jgi:hypothetical protein